jgi:hypothetical protein
MMLDGGHGMLSSALKTVRVRWEEVEGHWNDAMRQQFEAQVWRALEEYTATALEAIDQMQVVLAQMQRDCEGSRYSIHEG